MEIDWDCPCLQNAECLQQVKDFWTCMRKQRRDRTVDCTVESKRFNECYTDSEHQKEKNE